MKQTFLTPSEVAKKAGVTPSTVVHWENQGWLKATKTASGRRLFRLQDVEIFLEIRAERARQTEQFRRDKRRLKVSQA